jgi:hypothetical protein
VPLPGDGRQLKASRFSGPKKDCPPCQIWPRNGALESEPKSLMPYASSSQPPGPCALRSGFISFALVITLVAAASPAGARESAPKPPGWLDRLRGAPDERQVVVYSFVTDAGRHLTPPTSERPTRCRMVSGGYQEWGMPRAGEEPLPLEELDPLMRQAFQARSYEPMRIGAAADLVLIFHWGCMRPESELLPNPRMELPGRQLNMLDLVGGQSLAIANDRLTQTAIVEAAAEERYFLIVSAFVVSPADRETRTLVWRTQISVPLAGLTQAQAFPILAATGAGQFGQETPTPQFVTVDFKTSPPARQLARP